MIKGQNKLVNLMIISNKQIGNMPFRKKLGAKKSFRYINNFSTGISRIKTGRKFEYYDQERSQIVDPSILSRIHSLSIPPNWTDVWICSHKNGHIQATGLDNRQRKQYIYHPNWTSFRDKNKFGKLYLYGKGLPTLKKQLARDMKGEFLDQRFVCALAITIIQYTSIRPGNTIYRTSNGSFGLTTLQNKHVKIINGKLIFSYRGKRGIKQEKACDKKMICSHILRLLELPGMQLLQYLDHQNKKRPIHPTHLNNYLSEIYGGDVTSKTIRTWNACFRALGHLLENYPGNIKVRKKSTNELVRSVADHLGNTPSIARKSYICPVILEKFEAGKLDSWMKRNARANKRDREAAIQKKLLKLFKGCQDR